MAARIKTTWCGGRLRACLLPAARLQQLACPSRVDTWAASRGPFIPTACLQTLALYGTFLRAQRMPGGASMVALTRILHRSEDDELSPVLPTFRATPAHPGATGWL